MTHNLLAGKVAVIFGANGNLGKSTVKAYIEQGAKVYASSRNIDDLSKINGIEDVRVVDALDEEQIEGYLQGVIEKAGRIDVVMNLSGSDPAEYNHGHPASEVSLEQFMIPLKTGTATQFLTAKAAQKHMATQESGGVVIFITSTLAKVGSPLCTALTASHAATEGIVRSLANEWGEQGIRVIGVRAEAMPDSPVIDYTFSTMGQNMGGMSKDEMLNFVEQNKIALKRLPLTAEIAGSLVMAASDYAAYMTGTMLNFSGGHIME